MKAIQSFWTTPFLSNPTCGWLDRKYFFYSWAFSCLQIKKYYNTFELYTDSLGKKILIDHLKLPYDKVFVSLNDLPKEESIFWTLSKIYVCSLQREPFIHFDGDIFIWENLSSIKDFNIFGQNLEIDLYFNKVAFENIIPLCEYVPDFLDEYRVKNANFNSCNLGIFGGNDYEFLNKYSESCLDFIKKNSKSLIGIDSSIAPLLYEQMFLYYFAKNNNKPINYLFRDNKEYVNYTKDIYSNNTKIKYFHPYGNFKKQRINCMLVESLLSNGFPDVYERINKLLNDKLI